MFDYIYQFNAFGALSIGTLTKVEQLLYMRLFLINNSFHRREWFYCSNASIAVMAGLDEKTLIKTRNALKQKGFIDFIQGKKGEPTQYRLTILYDEETGVPLDYGEIKNTGIVPVEKPVEKPVKKPVEKPVKKPVYSPDNKEIRERERERERVRDTPLPPKGDVAGIDTLFLEFWKSYPRKVGKPVALKAYRRLNPSCSLHAEMMEALEKQKASAQWQKDGGQYIPHPSTWLNQRRWEDEQPVEMQPKRRTWIPTADELAEIRRLEAEYEH